MLDAASEFESSIIISFTSPITSDTNSLYAGVLIDVQIMLYFEDDIKFKDQSIVPEFVLKFDFEIITVCKTAASSFSSLIVIDQATYFPSSFEQEKIVLD